LYNYCFAISSYSHTEAKQQQGHPHSRFKKQAAGGCKKKWRPRNDNENGMERNRRAKGSNYYLFIL